MTLLKQLVYHTVEYNSVLWNPHHSQEQINKLESIQNNFLKRIHTEQQCDDYWDRLILFKLYSLQRRRERYCIIYTWKVIHIIYPNPGLSFNNTFEDHIALPNQGIQVNVHQRDDMTAHHNTNLPDWLKGKSVLERCCDFYNAMPLHLRQLIPAEKEPSVDKFKPQLDEWLSKMPDQPGPVPHGRFRPARSNSILDQLEYYNQI